MPTCGSKTSDRATPVSTTPVIPSMVIDVSATFVASTILRRSAGRAPGPAFRPANRHTAASRPGSARRPAVPNGGPFGGFRPRRAETPARRRRSDRGSAAWPRPARSAMVRLSPRPPGRIFRPGTAGPGFPPSGSRPSNGRSGSGASVADITTSFKSGRTVCCTRRTMARARSLLRLRSWNSSKTTTPTDSRNGSSWSIRSRIPSVTTWIRVCGRHRAVESHLVADLVAQSSAALEGHSPGTGCGPPAVAAARPRLSPGRPIPRPTRPAARGWSFPPPSGAKHRRPGRAQYAATTSGNTASNSAAGPVAWRFGKVRTIQGVWLLYLSFGPSGMLVRAKRRACMPAPHALRSSDAAPNATEATQSLPRLESLHRLQPHRAQQPRIAQRPDRSIEPLVGDAHEVDVAKVPPHHVPLVQVANAVRREVRHRHRKLVSLGLQMLDQQTIGRHDPCAQHPGR